MFCPWGTAQRSSLLHQAQRDLGNSVVPLPYSREAFEAWLYELPWPNDTTTAAERLIVAQVRVRGGILSNRAKAARSVLL